MEILDMECAIAGKEIADIVFKKESKKTETLITKSLGVLQEDGVYAFMLYLSSQKKDYMLNKAYGFLAQEGVLKNIFGTETDALKAIREKLSSKLDELLFAKELLERTLVYARYHAKALGSSTQGTSESSGENT